MIPYSKRKFAGPWLLTSAALTELDDLLEEIARSVNLERARRLHAPEQSDDDYELILARRQLQIAREERRLSILRSTSDAQATPSAAGAPPHPGDTDAVLQPLQWEVKVKLAGLTVVRGVSFGDCSKALRGTSDVPVAAEAELGVGTNGLKLEIGAFDEELDVEASTDHFYAASFLAGISEWAMQHQASRMVRAWAAAGRAWPVVLIVVVSFLMTLIPVALLSTSSAATLRRTREAEALLKDGLTDQEMRSAMALLLEHTMGLGRSSSAVLPFSAYILVALIMSVAILCFVRPATILGLNTAGTKALGFRIRWTNFWTWGAPAWLLASLLGITIEQWLWPMLRTAP